MPVESTPERYVLIRELAKYLGRDRGGLKSRIEALGIPIHAVGSPLSGQAADAVTSEDAKRIVALSKSRANVISPEELMGGTK